MRRRASARRSLALPRRIVAVEHREQRRRFQSLELPAVDRPEQRDAGADEDQDRQRNEEQQAGHASALRRPTGSTATAVSLVLRKPRPIRNAFRITAIELIDM